MAKNDAENFSIEIPLNASGIEGFKPDKGVKVLVKNSKGMMTSQVTQLNEKGEGMAAFRFDEHPGAVHVIVGPEDATDQELTGLQTISLTVSGRQWQQKNQLRVQPVVISAYYWWWWWRWCRTFTIVGKVVCANGTPVPGAKVCAYDVDWWWIWSNSQQIGCATTDINGAFEIKFRWCCGWWPWWWWRNRIWERNPVLTERVSNLLQQNPHIQLLPQTSNQPDLSAFRGLLANEGTATGKALAATDVEGLETVRSQLIKKLPASPELAQLRIWPWWPWGPWWDCTPDVIFKVTQDCITPNTVIVDETVADTRWNISNPLSVTLTANEKACCRRHCPEPPCEEGECLVITNVCGDPINEIGGNLGAPPAPAGYLRPGAVIAGTADYNGDRPYAGTVTLEKNSGDILNVDYYEVEFFSGGTWKPLPPGASVSFGRRWMLLPGAVTGDESFAFTSKPDAASVLHDVVESREHFEATHYLDWWPGLGFRFWITNETLLVPIDSIKFADGTYNFRIVGWQLSGSGELINRKVIPICGTEKDNNLVLTFDNQVLDNLTHPADHNCGGLHTCTQEPDTHISEVRVNGIKVNPCDTINATKGTLEVDFLAHDTDGHLAVYSLVATYGLNAVVNLLNLPSAAVTALVAGTQTGWVSGNAEGTYGVALAQGATAPHWYGGKYTLTVDIAEAFQKPCCYQFELRAYKRTVVDCNHNYAHNNLTEYSIGVGICPEVKID
jgi:hypothetical protein